ncbi:MAG: hypothetical protein SNJ67_01305 [Chloracidobacterium sp.]|uniref:Roadblock/LC7 domain protein n=1 Tax=Chloracidobacterium validum TaxID=2821543 RepID=A0ABX8BB29_9BACT|nr:hypothetical protein [Chloracidobacterium validum]QUW02864.1 hypothetical protein J8C06_11120 [Chloracidobacterium validum]
MRGVFDRVDGACGWAFLADDGEIVFRHTSDDFETLPLLAAYHGITVGNYRRFGLRDLLGNIRTIVCAYDEAICVLKLFPESYFLVFVLKREANVGYALWLLDQAMPALLKEIE